MAPMEILLVDDEPHILHVMGLKLMQAGYDVLTATDGDEALSIATDRRPALVITDYQMPYMSGLTLSEELRRTPQTNRTPVMLITAHGFGLDRALLNQTNVSEVISKPFSPREVLGKVRTLVATPLVDEAA